MQVNELKKRINAWVLNKKTQVHDTDEENPKFGNSFFGGFISSNGGFLC